MSPRIFKHQLVDKFAYGHKGHGHGMMDKKKTETKSIMMIETA